MNSNNKIIRYFSNLLNITKPDIYIYIIEDNQYYAKLIKANLNKVGYDNVDIFYSGELAINSIDKKEPNCIILDHILSNKGMNGVDVLKHVKKNNPNINVVVLSGQQDVKIASDLMKYGAFDYIVKNDMTFFNLENTLFKLSRILIMNNRNITKYGIIFILLVLVIILIFVL